MNLELLRSLGFTPGEMKVYGALVKLQRSTITQIIKHSGVSSSKVYEILDRLAGKGLVSYSVQDNVREYQLASPEAILDYIREEKRRIDSLESEGAQFVSQLKKTMQDSAIESSQIYRGIQGVKTAHMNLLNELKRGEEYVFFSVEGEILREPAVQKMYTGIHERRDEFGIKARGIAPPKLKQTFIKSFRISKKYDIRYHELTLNQGITIGKNRIIMENTYPEPFAVEIISSKMAKSYKDFFNRIWKLAKP